MPIENINNESNKYFVPYKKFVDSQLEKTEIDKFSNLLLGDLNRFTKNVEDECNKKLTAIGRSGNDKIKKMFDEINEYLYSDEGGLATKIRNLIQNNGPTSIISNTCMSLNELLLKLISIFKGAIALVNRYIKSIVDSINNAASALENFLFVIDNCIMNALNKVLELLTALVDGAINTVLKAFDWDGLTVALSDCPALKCWLEDVFSKYIGKPICSFLGTEPTDSTTSPSELVDCIKAFVRQYGDLTQLDVVTAIRDTIQDLIQKVSDAKKFLQRKVRDIFKSYFTFLYRKRKVSDPLMTSQMFTLYDMYYCNPTDRMSFIDLIEVLEGLIVCLASICSNFSKKGKEALKTIKKELMLDMQMWKRYLQWGQTYFSQLGDNRRKEEVRAQFISRKTNTDSLEKFTAKLSVINAVIDEKRYSIVGQKPVEDKKFLDNVESILVKLYRNLGDDIIRYESIYNELSDFDASYEKTALAQVKSTIDYNIDMKGNGKSANELYSYSIPYVLPFANKEIKVEQFKNVVKKYDKDALEHYSVIFNELYSIP